MITLLKTDSTNTDFILLVNQLDAYLAIIDGDEHTFYNGLNKIDNIKHVLVAYENDAPVGCAAMKPFAPNAMEIKRMFILPDKRGKGIALQLLHSLESWAAETGFTKCVLETGKRMPEAIALYEKAGYKRIANYGQYVGVANSVCFEKELF